MSDICGAGLWWLLGLLQKIWPDLGLFQCLGIKFVAASPKENLNEYEAYYFSVLRSLGVFRFLQLLHVSTHRDIGVRRYAWAIPNKQALDIIAGLCGPGTSLLDFGAGAGFWCYALRSRLPETVIIQALDNNLGRYERETGFWYPVHQGDVADLQGLDFDVILLVWPNWADDMAIDVLHLLQAHHSAATLVYIGEPRGGVNAESRFFDELELHWTLEETADIPQWPGRRDALHVYRQQGRDFRW